MAVEVKVFKEITEYRAKVFFGMTWRQFLVAVTGLPLLGGVFAICYLFGQDEIGIVLVFILGIPFAAIGWVYPMGIKIEKYISFYLQHLVGKKIFLYQQTPFISKDDDESSQQKILDRSKPSGRKAFAAFEQTN